MIGDFSSLARFGGMERTGAVGSFSWALRQTTGEKLTHPWSENHSFASYLNSCILGMFRFLKIRNCYFNSDWLTLLEALLLLGELRLEDGAAERGRGCVRHPRRLAEGVPRAVRPDRLHQQLLRRRVLPSGGQLPTGGLTRRTRAIH